MNMVSIITKKKLGQELIPEEIECFFRVAADNPTPVYQLPALLMAIRLQGCFLYTFDAADE